MDRSLRVHVECYSGYRGEEVPWRFDVGVRKVEASEVLDRWLAPDHRYFKVRGDNGEVYVLRHDADTQQWEVVVAPELDHVRERP